MLVVAAVVLVSAWHAPGHRLPILRTSAATQPRAATLHAVIPEPEGTRGVPSTWDIDSAPPRSDSSWRAKLPPKEELKKIVPLAIMFFAILFNYTILRDTKDVLVVTAPGGSAEAIPFLKTWVNLPGAIAFTVAYSKMANRLGPQQLFYATLVPFLAFFGAFAWLIYPLCGVLHPVGFATWLAAALPAALPPPTPWLQNWTYSPFYLFFLNISRPTRLRGISYPAFCFKKKKNHV